MPAVARLDPRTIFTPEEWAQLSPRSSWRGLVLVAGAWGLILAAGALFIVWPNPLSYVLAVMIIGARQLGLAILMHDAAHGALHSNSRINDWVGEWLCAAPVGARLRSYRDYHLKHHRYTEQPEDPDLALSAPFPITRKSLWRKMLRDLTGQTFLKQRTAQFLGGRKPGEVVN
ncbi:MAG: fatty acid desaturase family protein, partial [Hyphomonadaceae bacterium]|nr:fatty acid desaturase family protein [Hyphomonadaceae bacterium]